MIKNLKRLSALFFMLQTTSMAMEKQNDYLEASHAPKKVTFENPDKEQNQTPINTKKKKGLPLDRIRKAHENAKANATHGTLESGQYQLTKPAENERNKIKHTSTKNKENDESVNCAAHEETIGQTSSIKSVKKELKRTKGIP